MPSDISLPPHTRLLVSIAFHYVESRFVYLQKVVEHFLRTYPIEVHVNVQTNHKGTGTFLASVFPDHAGVSVTAHETLAHPFHLTFQHRRYFADRIEAYDYFFYIEDDILVPFKGFSRYAETFDGFYEKGRMFSFLRYEIADGRRFHTDSVGITSNNSPPVQLGSGTFFVPQFPYHGFWILPRHVLRACVETRNDYFANHNPNWSYREHSASYTLWGLGLQPYVEVCPATNKVAEWCLCHHLPNNYALDPTSHHGKCEIDTMLT